VLATRWEKIIAAVENAVATAYASHRMRILLERRHLRNTRGRKQAAMNVALFSRLCHCICHSPQANQTTSTSTIVVNSAHVKPNVWPDGV
jgi:hypothetical protein